MRFKPKGHKIYHQKTRFERLRAFVSNTGAVILTLAIMGVLGFVGYSAGGPVLRFLQDSHVLSPPPPPVPTEAPTEPTEPPTELTEAPTEPPTEPPTQPTIRGYAIPSDAMESEEALQEAVSRLPEDATHVFVPLKSSGGVLHYATALPDARRANAVQAALPLETIYQITAATGATPVAILHTLDDSIYPHTFTESAYRFTESGEPWLDAPAESGGKSRLSPFSTLTKDYLSDLAAEAAAAGFSAIQCEGLGFPPFSQDDLQALPSECSAGDRNKALIDVVAAMQAAAPDAAFYVGLSGAAILGNVREIARAADAMEIDGVIIHVDAASAANTDILKDATPLHPPVFAWDGIPVPPSERSYVRALPAKIDLTDTDMGQTDVPNN